MGEAADGTSREREGYGPPTLQVTLPLKVAPTDTVSAAQVTEGPVQVTYSFDTHGTLVSSSTSDRPPLTRGCTKHPGEQHEPGRNGQRQR